MEGYVYVIINEENTLVKIGRSVHDPKIRFTSHLKSTPHPLMLVFWLKYANHQEAEKKAHSFFKAKRYKQEWFIINWQEAFEYFMSTDYKGFYPDTSEELIKQYGLFQVRRKQYEFAKKGIVPKVNGSNEMQFDCINMVEIANDMKAILLKD
jgi:hypothetical protein